MIALVFLVAESDPLLLPGDEFSFQPAFPASTQFYWSGELPARDHLLNLAASECFLLCSCFSSISRSFVRSFVVRLPGAALWLHRAGRRSSKLQRW